MPFISDITHLQNRALLFIDGLYTLNRYLHSLMKLLLSLMMMIIMNITIRSSTSNGRTQRIWDCSMCTEEGHALGREMITLGM